MVRLKTLELTAALVLGAVSAILAGCSPGPQAPGGLSANGALLSRLPGPDRFPHEISAAQLLELQGRECETAPQQNVAAQGLGLDLSPSYSAADPAFEQFAFAAFAFNITGYSGPSTLTCQWQTPPADGTCYIGFADWAADSWRWFAAPTDGSALDVDGLAPFADGTGKVLAVVLTTGSAPSLLKSIRIGAGTAGAHWHQIQFNSDPLSIGNLSLLDINGVPGILATNLDLAHNTEQLLLLRASDADASAIDPPVVVSTNPDLSFQMQVASAMIHGVPAAAILALGSDQDFCYYTQASDARGDTWPVIPTLVVPNSNLFNPLLREVDGRPAVVLSGTGSNFRDTPVYVRANDPDGSSWPGMTQLNSGLNNIVGMDFEIVDGAPSIFAVEDLAGLTSNYTFTQAGDTAGTTWGPWHSITTLPAGTAPYRGLAVLNSGLPAVVLNATDAFSFRSSGPPHNSWPVGYSTQMETASSLDFEVIGGTPYLAECPDSSATELMLNSCSGSDIDSWGTPQQLADDVAGYSLDMTSVGGRPAIAVGNYNSGQRSQYVWLFMYY